jgi:adenine-specific DNA-methyltransferase
MERDKEKTTAVLIESSESNAGTTLSHDNVIWRGDAEVFMKGLPLEPIFDLVVTSPPYNIGKEYEKKEGLDKYLEWQKHIIDEIVPRLKTTGSLCWQVGNFVDNGEIVPLDIEFAPIFKAHRLKLRNRIVWHFGHGLHTKRRFSGRYEVVMWYTKSDKYIFNLDAIRVPSKYPGKKHFKGPNTGQISGNPLGKNPEDVWNIPEDIWNIPNVKSNHVEKAGHPCQFPVGLIERLVLSMTDAGGLVFDPFAGVSSAGVAAVLHGRRFIGCEIMTEYAKIGVSRLQLTLDGVARYRPHDKPLYDYTKSRLSISPWGREEKGEKNEMP